MKRNLSWKRKFPINVCGKRKFKKKEAQTALNAARSHIRGRMRKVRRERRYYHCPQCNAWHLSSH